MARHRIFISLPEHEYKLLVRWGVMSSRCKGQVASAAVKAQLYRAVQTYGPLADYDQELRDEERADVIRDVR